MTDLLEKAVRTARTLPPEMQDEIARMMLLFADGEQDDDVVQLTPEEVEAIQISADAEARGDFASDEEIAAIWAKRGL